MHVISINFFHFYQSYIYIPGQFLLRTGLIFSTPQIQIHSLSDTGICSPMDHSKINNNNDRCHTLILVYRLHTHFGFTDTVLQWFSPYLTGRTHYVSLSSHCSALAPVHSGVPRGSVLGPMLFTTYIKPLSAIIDSHSIMHHSFADDLQLLVFTSLYAVVHKPCQSLGNCEHA